MNIADAVGAIGRLAERLLKAHRTNCSAEETATALSAIRECERRHYEYFEDLYYNEEKRRDAFNTVSSFLLGVLGIAGAIGTFYLRDVLSWLPKATVPTLIHDWTVWAFLIVLLVDTVFFARASYFLVRSLYNYSYQYLAPPNEILGYHQQLTDLYPNPLDAEKAFQHYLVTEYAAAAQRNDANNITKRRYIHQCTTNSIYVFILLGVTFVPFFAHKLRHHETDVLPIRWDEARIKIEAGNNPSPSVINFDNAWPKVDLSPNTQFPDAGESKATPPEARIPDSDSEAAPAKAAAAKTHKRSVPKKR
jgi:hypothetical protein